MAHNWLEPSVLAKIVATIVQLIQERPAQLARTTTMGATVRFARQVSSNQISFIFRMHDHSSMTSLGYYCSSTSATPVACGANTYSFAGSTGSGDCDTCPAGHSCGSSDMSPVACEPGQYSAAGTMECSPCPAGMYCPTPESQVTITGSDHYSAVS